jgi:hypothetical protein
MPKGLDHKAPTTISRGPHLAKEQLHSIIDYRLLIVS